MNWSKLLERLVPAIFGNPDRMRRCTMCHSYIEQGNALTFGFNVFCDQECRKEYIDGANW